jgi:hypothetical protein
MLLDEHLCIGAKIDSGWNNIEGSHNSVIALFVEVRY